MVPIKEAAMKTLLTNVGVIMRKEFGPGAEGAARTFQGVINRMQNSFKLLYESFEPVAVGFLNSVVMPLTSGIKTVTDGFNAFFTGQAAQTAGGSVFAKQLELLRPTFEGIAANIKQVLPLLQSFANTALSLGQVLLQIAGNPFAGYLARIYLSVLPLTVALRVLNLQVLIPLIGSFLRAIPAFISFNAAMISGTSANKGLQLAMQLTGQTAGVTAGKIRLVGAALATLGTTAILAGIGLLIERFLMMKSAIDGVRQSTQQMLGSISGMANTGAVKELQNVSRNIQKQKDTFAELKKFVYGGRLGGGSKALTPEMAAKFEEVGMGSFVSKNLFGKPMIADFLRATEIIDARLQSLNKESSSVAEKLPLAVKVAADIAKQAKTAETIAPIPPAGTEGGGDGGKDKGADDAKRLGEEIARQAAAASDALFAEQQRLLILQQTNPIAEAIAKYTSEEASIQRELNAGLKEAKSEKEKIDLKEAARLEGAANRLELEQSINDEAEKALKPITDLLASQREELALTTETEKLMKEGISPERAKQIAQVRLLVKQQLEALDLSIDQADAAITEAKARGASAKAVEDLIAALDRLKEKRREGEEQGKAGEEGVPKDKPKDYLGDALTSAEARLKELLNPAYQLAEAAKTIGDSFGEAFKGIITGSMTVQEAFAGLFQSIADRFADMVAEMIARWLEAQLIQGFLSLFPGAAPAAEASQAVLRFADGGVASGGFRAFANGGVVSGPTLGLVGEGRYNEAVIPLPDGKSVPVDLGGMAGGMGGEVTSNIVVNINNGQMQGNGNSNGSELGRKIEGAVKQVLVSELRPGGILSSGRR
jgi:hypothetical protein